MGSLTEDVVFNNSTTLQILPSGQLVLLEYIYNSIEMRGVMAIAIAAGISLISILLLVIATTVSAYASRNKSRDETTIFTFLRSHVGIYFISLIIGDAATMTGFFMSMRWSIVGRVQAGDYCVAQAALKQSGNVAVALSCAAIAFHTFFTVFLQVTVPRWTRYVVTILIWATVATTSLIGPFMIQTPERGPWWGISSQWCWTTDNYRLSRFTTEYMFMFATAFLNFLLYLPVFLRLKGFFRGTGWHTRVQFSRQMVSAETLRVANHMLWYPFAYACMVAPIAVVRVVELATNRPAPFLVKSSLAVVFMLSGLCNVVLYTTTRRIFPSHSGTLLSSTFRKSPRPLSVEFLGRDTSHSTSRLSSTFFNKPISNNSFSGLDGRYPSSSPATASVDTLARGPPSVAQLKILNESRRSLNNPRPPSIVFQSPHSPNSSQTHVAMETSSPAPPVRTKSLDQVHLRDWRPSLSPALPSPTTPRPS